MKKLFFLILPNLILLSAVRVTAQEIPAEKYMKRSSAFIKKYYSKDYSYSDETVTYQGMFDRYAEADWAGTVTLKSRKTYKIAGLSDPHKRLFYSFYYFDDTSKVKLCFDSLIACFQPGCHTITPYHDVPNMTHAATVYLFNPHSIISLQVNCPELPDNYASLRSTLLSNFRTRHSIIITTDCDGMLRWEKPEK